MVTYSPMVWERSLLDFETRSALKWTFADRSASCKSDMEAAKAPSRSILNSITRKNNWFWENRCTSSFPHMTCSNCARSPLHVSSHYERRGLFWPTHLSLSSGPLHLNRQAIALLESRRLPQSIFLLLQNQHMLWLIESLLYPPSTFELLNERLPRNLFQLRDLILVAQVDLIHEPFFRQLITTVCKQEIKRIEVREWCEEEQ